MTSSVQRLGPVQPAIELSLAVAAVNQMAGEDDTYITELVLQATEEVEDLLRRALITQVFGWTLAGSWCDGSPCTCGLRRDRLIRVPYAPVIDITSASAFKQRDDMICVDPHFDDTLEFTAGYGATPADVPPGLRSLVIRRFVELYENRSERVVGAGVGVIQTIENHGHKYRRYWA